jgi:Ser/Thr protein kinase RdoA (MazF antagonist)
MTAAPELHTGEGERLVLLEQILGAPVMLEELKHKRGRRRTLRARGAERTAIVKLYASDRTELVAARIGALADGPPEPAVPRLLAIEPALHMVVLSHVPGRPLREALLTADTAACRRAGEALGAWHRAWRSCSPAPLRGHTPERELELLERRAEGMAPAVAGAVRAAARELGEPWPVPTVVHRDLYEEQVLLGDQVGLIDLDDVALGPPELDLGNLLAHIQLLTLRTGDRLDAMSEQLLAGYAGFGGTLDAPLLDRCRRLTLLRLACIHDRPDLLELAQREALSRG